MGDMLEQLTPALVDGLKLVIGAAAAFAVLWLQRRGAELRDARAAALQVELDARAAEAIGVGPSGEEKLAAAQQLLAQKHAARHAARIEQVLPKVRKQADESMRPPAPPPLPPRGPTLISIVLVLLLLVGCGLLPRARTVNDIARDYCEEILGRDPELQGLDVEDLCLLPNVIGPFLEAPAAARLAARAAAQRPAASGGAK